MIYHSNRSYATIENPQKRAADPSSAKPRLGFFNLGKNWLGGEERSKKSFDWAMDMGLKRSNT